MRLSLRNLAACTVTAAAALVVAWLFGLPELAALAVAGWVALGATAAWVRLARAPQLRATISPAACERGETAVLELRFVAGAHASAQARLFGRLGTAGQGIVAIGRLDEGQSAPVRIELPTPTRGLVTVGPLQVLLTDPLGWWHTERPAATTAALLVRPKVHQLADNLATGGRMPSPGSHSGSALTGADADADLVGLRPYVPGDDLRRVHWRTSARRNEPHVVQVEPPARAPGTTVVLDQGPDSTAGGFERAVEAAASVLTAAAMEGRTIRLVLTHPAVGTDDGDHRAEPADSGDLTASGLADLLDTLATIDRRPGDPTVAIDVSAGAEDTVVLCTASRADVAPDFGGCDVVVSCDEANTTMTPHGARLVHWLGDTSLGDAWRTAVEASWAAT